MTRPDQHEGDELDDTVLVVRAAPPSTVPDDDTVVRPPRSSIVPDDDTIVPDDDTIVRVPVVPEDQRGGGSSAAPVPVPPVPTARRVHALRVGTETRRLDAPVVVGRRPTAPRVSTGAPVALVVVPSPTGEVSSSHVRVEQVGATVVVTDLRSTNGTVVTMPGRLPVTLRQGESSVALAGTIVDVGDGNLLEILPPPRPAAQEEPRP